MKVPLTVVIPTLDEAAQIAETVAHLSWADEVIVADAGSRDDTVARARRAGARVLERTGPTIAAQRNQAVATARNRWIFALDADERIPPALAEELAAVIAAPAHPVYKVRRRNFYLGRELTRGHWGRDWVTRLHTRDRRWIERRVHETLERVPDPGHLVNCLDHHPYRDLGHQLEKMGRYARWGAEDLYEQGRRATAWDLAVRPLGRFLKAYLLKGHCLDGRAGLVSSVLGAYTAFLKYAHLWALERKQ
ncbi:MAG TPA: glycosyltransferase family 2 protein [Gemmatimonadales bacterium]|nr:glycosyltransferase family 2 protein [Gemmatimonadales bacterium]